MRSIPDAVAAVQTRAGRIRVHPVQLGRRVDAGGVDGVAIIHQICKKKIIIIEILINQIELLFNY